MTVYVVLEMRPGGHVHTVCAFSSPEAVYQWVEDNKHLYGALWSEAVGVQD